TPPSRAAAWTWVLLVCKVVPVAGRRSPELAAIFFRSAGLVLLEDPADLLEQLIGDELAGDDAGGADQDLAAVGVDRVGAVDLLALQRHQRPARQAEGDALAGAGEVGGEVLDALADADALAVEVGAAPIAGHLLGVEELSGVAVAGLDSVVRRRHVEHSTRRR